jgi:Susd and RagB outer membrane lipoprotein
LSPVIDAKESRIPTRLYYNSNEISLNKANYEAAVGTLTGGDKLTTPLWWMN